MAAKNDLPDQAYLRECFNYDPATGSLTWRARPKSAAYCAAARKEFGKFFNPN